MPRNDQATRQWTLLKKLENSRGATLHELAAALSEDSVRHPRTIRRDLEALEARFPLMTERVNGQTRWRLMEGVITSLHALTKPSLWVGLTLLSWKRTTMMDCRTPLICSASRIALSPPLALGYPRLLPVRPVTMSLRVPTGLT